MMTLEEILNREDIDLDYFSIKPLEDIYNLRMEDYPEDYTEDSYYDNYFDERYYA